MDNHNLKRHISGQFNTELDNIRNRVLLMGGLVEKQLTDAIVAISTLEQPLAEAVIANDAKVNAFEVLIDEEGTRIIAKRQPAAGDLRLIFAISKTVTDLERIGDEAIKLSKNAIQMSEADSSPRQFVELRNLGERVKTMLGLALDAYARMDVDEALRIIQTDKLIDEEFDNISRLLITRMMEDPREIKNSLRISHCARALERIGDHSKNICEFVVYLVKGKDVRHGNMGVLEE